MGLEESFIKHYAENKLFVQRVLRRRVFRNDLEDAEQTVWLKAWENYPSYEERGLFSHWIGRIAVHYGLNYVRGQRFMKTISEDYPQSNTIEQDVLSSELEGIIAAINPVFGDALRYKLLGYDVNETAQLMGVSVGTVCSRWNRGVRDIREQWVN
jgi:RNA polymerase sigma factor (sigma-70 family)